MNGYYIDDYDNGGCIMQGGGVVYEGDDCFSLPQLRVLCDVLNSGPEFDAMSWEQVDPYWQIECERRGVDMTPPWKVEATLKDGRVPENLTIRASNYMHLI